jgi:hypothetical protein
MFPASKATHSIQRAHPNAHTFLTSSLCSTHIDVYSAGAPAPPCLTCFLHTTNIQRERERETLYTYNMYTHTPRKSAFNLGVCVCVCTHTCMCMIRTSVYSIVVCVYTHTHTHTCIKRTRVHSILVPLNALSTVSESSSPYTCK